MIQSPNGALWSVVDEQDGVITLALERLPDGTPATFTNHQQFTRAEMEAGRGWRGVQ